MRLANLLRATHNLERPMLQSLQTGFQQRLVTGLRPHSPYAILTRIKEENSKIGSVCHYKHYASVKSANSPQRRKRYEEQGLRGGTQYPRSISIGYCGVITSTSRISLGPSSSFGTRSTALSIFGRCPIEKYEARGYPSLQTRPGSCTSINLKAHPYLPANCASDSLPTTFPRASVKVKIV